MTISPDTLRPLLKQFEFVKLFNELGWDHLKTTHPLHFPGASFTLTGVAEKKGVQIYVCSPDPSGKIPDYATRRKIDHELSKLAFEHLLIFADKTKTMQVWQWLAREPGKTTALRHATYYSHQSGDALLQKLDRITFSLPDEEWLTLTNVTYKLRGAFDKDNLTKTFYKEFEKKHQEFAAFISGIPDDGFQKWYASVMINRLMFLYFVQEKGFLADKKRYLQEKLKMSKGQFYKDFLCPLFFEGFAKREHERSTNYQMLFGKIPYLNGGIFAKHQVEIEYEPTIAISDNAFQTLFAFFDDWNWHLDDRPTASGKEINPDVLGYIFEKYINYNQPGEQKAKGAYYTREDITGYISKNTILPFLFDRTRYACDTVFTGSRTLWYMLSDDPDRYIYDAVRHGIDIPYPPEVAVGLTDISKRDNWNERAPVDAALGTETWREVVARRTHYHEIHEKLSNGEVRDIDVFVTYNLNIRQFAQDALERTEGVEFLRAVWDVLQGSGSRPPLSVLDPTCGSGAFLFAALEILEPLYEACLDRMQSFVSDADQLGRNNDYPDFRKILREAALHLNRSYFVFKSIIVNNLYGVDIMEEAAEICKLRLFLKLASLVEPDKTKDNLGIEPLPDIDFNIRAGNTLVGYASEKQVKEVISGKGQQNLDLYGKWPAFEQRLKKVQHKFEVFQQLQIDLDVSSGSLAEAKAQLQNEMGSLHDELDVHIGHHYGVIGKTKLERWKKSAKPFHWFVEFYKILNFKVDGGGQSGFDIIIGNPPYVEYAKVSKDYAIKGYSTEHCGNLYAFVMERCEHLLKAAGRTGMIVPHSAICTDRMAEVQELFNSAKCVWLSTYDIRPAKLFVGVDQRLLIYLYQSGGTNHPRIQSTQYHRWSEEVRDNLFATIQYADISTTKFPNSLPKLHTSIETILWKKLHEFQPLSRQISPRATKVPLYFHNAPRYWIRAMDFVPYFWNERDGEAVSSHLKPLYFSVANDTFVSTALLNSSLFYWWFIMLSNCRDLTLREIEYFPVGLGQMENDVKLKLVALSEQLMVDLKKHAFRKDCMYKTTGRVIYDEFYPRHSKPIIDEIDRVLAKHYGFTPEETDFIINYDVKYRMGKGGDGEE